MAVDFLPQFNPEITFGSICVIISLIFTTGGLYKSFANKISSNADDIVSTRRDLTEAIGNMTKIHTEALDQVRMDHKDLQKDIKTHIAANNDQHVAIMSAVADLKIGNAVASNDIDGIKEVQRQHSARIDAISERQTLFLKSHVAGRN